MTVQTKGRPGRPTERTPEIVERIFAELHKGKPEYVAAAVAGIKESTFRNWKKIDPEFCEEVARARRIGCSVLHDQAALGDEPGQGFGPGKVALEFLSRRYPKDYSTKIQVSVEYEMERILDAVEGVCSPEDFQRVLARLTELDSGTETERDFSEDGNDSVR